MSDKGALILLVIFFTTIMLGKLIEFSRCETVHMEVTHSKGIIHTLVCDN